MVFTIQGCEKKSITFKKYEIKTQHGIYKTFPKKLEKIPAKEKINPKDKIHGITGKTKMLDIGAEKDITPKL